MSVSVEKPEDYVQHLLSDKGDEPIDNGAKTVEIDLPTWYDKDLFKKGQQYYLKYVAGMGSGMFVGLLAVLAIPSILKVLICSRQSGTVLDAYKRYLRTTYHVISWHDNEMKPGSKAWQSATMVRKTHFSARKSCERAQSITIMQRDMALTQFGFMGFILLTPHMFGLPNDEEFLEATVHLWRVVGHLMGIKDEFNLCTDSYKTTRPRLEAIIDRVYRPALEKTDSDFDRMSQALIGGLWNTDWTLSFRPYVYFAKRIAGCKGYEYFQSDFKKPVTRTDLSQKKYLEFSWLERITLFYYIFMHEYLYPIAIFRIIFNFRSYMVILLSYYFPISAIYNFGIKKAYVRIFHGKNTEPHFHKD